MEQQPQPTTVYTSTTEQPYMDNYEYTHTQYTHTEIQQCTLTYFHAGKPNEIWNRERLGLGLWVDLFNL